MRGIYLGLGSNLGDRLQNMRQALEKLEQRGVRLERVSSVYETAPIGKEDQPAFLNAVVEISTELPPRALLESCLEIETELGRVRAESWGARTVDIDMLLYGDLELDTDDLVLPHPRITRRRFVLEPLLEIAPDLKLPGGRRVDAFLKRVADQKAKRVGPPLKTSSKPQRRKCD